MSKEPSKPVVANQDAGVPVEALPSQATRSTGDQSAPLAGLMAHGEQVAATPGPDLEATALRAAEAALAQGEQALAEARAQLQTPAGGPVRRPSRARELFLRILLLSNLAAMVVVVALPLPRDEHPAPPSASPQPGSTAAPTVPPAPAPRLDDRMAAAFAAGERRDYATAIEILEGYLQESPRLQPARRANVLLALEHYAAQSGNLAAAQDYHRRNEALLQAHSLPEDLLAMAREAEASGDTESMRRVYARFLLQQRQIPSWLYKHVAEAYLKLGDSYRQGAEQADEAQRKKEIEQVRDRLRATAVEPAKAGPK